MAYEIEIKAPAKVNIFLKITGTKGGYHTLRSRFVRVDDLYDTIKFIKRDSNSDTPFLECNIDLPEKNTISLSFKLLADKFHTVKKFFKAYKVVLNKKIPTGAGLGGGSSDAAAFLRGCNEVCELNLTSCELAKIGQKIGADVPFFVHNYQSANVEGIGEIVTPFEEQPLKLKLFTPNIHCDTAKVYKTFRKEFFYLADKDSAKEWLEIDSLTLLKEKKREDLNDLFLAAIKAYPELKTFTKPDHFFSGSGSTFFWIED